MKKQYVVVKTGHNQYTVLNTVTGQTQSVWASRYEAQTTAATLNILTKLK